MKKATILVAVLAAAMASLIGVGAPTAKAAGTVPLGGGSAILVPQGSVAANACTVTAVGRPTSGAHRGELIAITAGHCGTVGQKVLSERYQQRGQIGTIAYTASDIDVAVIRLDAARVRPVRTVDGLTLRGIDTRRPPFGTVLCKTGRTTGKTCGITWIDDGVSHISQMCVIEGDSGAPVVRGDKLVGMVNAYFVMGCIGPETGTGIGTILHRLDKIGYGGFQLV